MNIQLSDEFYKHCYEIVAYNFSIIISCRTAMLHLLSSINFFSYVFEVFVNDFFTELLFNHASQSSEYALTLFGLLS